MGKYSKYCIPILKAMQDRKEYKMSDLVPMVCNILNVPSKERNERKKNGHLKIYTDISFAKMDLERAELIEKTKPMMYRITHQGLKVLVENPVEIDKNYLSKFSPYVECKNNGLKKNNILKEKSKKKPPNISDLWQILQSKLDCDIRQQGSYYSLFYNNKRFAIIYVQKKSIKITYTLSNLQHIMPNTVSKSTSPYVKDPKTGKHDGFDQYIKDMNDINIAIGIINKIKSIINKSNNKSHKTSNKEAMRTVTHTPIIEKTDNYDIKTKLLDKIKTISPKDFEILVGNLLEKMGYGEYTRTGKTGDNGIDGFLCVDELGFKKTYMQAKKWKYPVGERELRDFVGALKSNSDGVFITTSRFTPAAKKYIEFTHVNLKTIDGTQLVELLIKYGITVKRTAVIDDDYFSNR